MCQLYSPIKCKFTGLNSLLLLESEVHILYNFITKGFKGILEKVNIKNYWAHVLKG